MKKGGSRFHVKRVSGPPKERRCGGVPCTLLVAAWSLFLLLLLSTSISHRDEQDRGFYAEKAWRSLFSSQTSRQILFGTEDEHVHGDEHCFIDGLMDLRSGEHVERDKADNGIFPRFAVLEQSAGGTHELTNGECEPVDNSGALGTPDSCSLPLFAEHDEKLDESDYFRNEKERLSSVDAVVFPTRITFQDFGEPIDALQYAEYGAGLLKKNGPAEETSKICLIRSPGGTDCRMISHHHGEFTGQECIGPQGASGAQDLPCLQEFLSEELCHDARTYGGDVVAELEPGESYLVCHRDSLAGTVICEVACTSQSDCFLSAVDSKLCHFDGSIADLFRHTCQAYRGGLGQHEALTAEPGLSNEIYEMVEAESVQTTSPHTIQNDVDLFSPVTDFGSESDSLRLSQQDVDTTREISEEGELAEIPARIVFVEDIIPESTSADHALELTDADIQRKFDAEELSSSHVTKDSSIGESLEDLRQSLLQEEDRTWEESDFDDEPLTSVVEPERHEERRLKRVGSVLSLDEYKRSILEAQQKSGNQVNLSSVQTHKIRHSDESYNYAASAHGAKVLASNKEANGASHILVSDKDKYLRNPCGAEDKYVVLELSEETFVDTLVISNFEFHSSNLKDFELLGSPVYPAKEWISLGRFQAENVRQRQKFNIEDPKLVRHLTLKMLTHWGSEFFCTLSGVEVFGVDVIQNILDDWIALEEVDNNARTQGTNGHAVSTEESGRGSNGQQLDASAGTALDAPFTEPLFNPLMTDLSTGSDQGSAGARNADGDDDSMAGPTVDSVQEIVHSPGGKPAGDSVLKILMQRVKALELNQTLLNLYLGDMNQKYKVMLSELDKDLALVTERLQNETALTASLALRLADRELQRKEEKLYMEHRFAQIASNFTDNLEFMRWQIQSMERREITAIMLAFLCMILSALLHLLARCFPRRPSTQDFSVQTVREDIDGKLDSLSLSAVCHSSSIFTLYLASGLTVLILSV